jgi:hypothetical protein
MGIREQVKHGDLEPSQALIDVKAKDPNPSPYLLRWLDRRIKLGLTCEKVKELAEEKAKKEKAERKKRQKAEAEASRKAIRGNRRYRPKSK